MAERRREGGDPVGEVLRAFTAPAPDERIVDAIPEDFALVDPHARVMHGSVTFSGTVAAGSLPSALRELTRSRRRDILGIAWTLLCLAPSGRAALLVPQGILGDATQGHHDLRRRLVQSGRLRGVIRLAPGCVKGRSSAAILLLGPSFDEGIWFCSVTDARELQAGADGSPPSCVARWRRRGEDERERARTDSSFVVPTAEVTAAQFDLAMERYREVTEQEAPVVRPHEILAEITGLEAEIFQGIRDLVGLLKT